MFFKGEIPYSHVAKEMQGSHVFILNSNIENSPCVIGEALSCGLPVIATRVGGISELVNEQNGILIEPQNTKQLTEAMIDMYYSYHHLQQKQIATDAEQKFSFTVMGQLHHQLYK